MGKYLILLICCVLGACSSKDNSRKALLPDGKVIGYWEGTDQVMYEKEWRDKKPHGTWKEFDHDGHLLQQYQYDKAVKTGAWIQWYPNGKKASEGGYVNGEPEGVWKRWADNGTLVSEGAYNQGKETGVWRAWYDNGRKMYEGRYLNGQKDGVHRNYSDDGAIEAELQWKTGTLVEEAK